MNTRLTTWAASTALACLLLASSGCVTGRGWQGIFPGKDVEMLDGEIIVATPWGTQTIRASRIATRIAPSGAVPLPVLTNRQPYVVTGDGKQVTPSSPPPQPPSFVCVEEGRLVLSSGGKKFLLTPLTNALPATPGPNPP